MKSTCVLPPLSDIFHNHHYPINHRYNSNQQEYSIDRRRSSHPMLHVSNLLSSNNSNSSSNGSSSSEEDEYYDDEPVKAKRKRASPSQLSVLNRVFQQTFFPSTELRMELGKQLGMSPRTVQIWFQNKRQSLRTRERVVVYNTPPVSPYNKPVHISLPPLRLPSNNNNNNSWPLTPTSSFSSNNSSPSSPFDSFLFRDA